MIRLETGLATYRVVITGHITTQSHTPGEKDDPGEWDMSALMTELESGCCEVTECAELLTTEENADLQEEAREARSDIVSQAKIIHDLRDKLDVCGLNTTRRWLELSKKAKKGEHR